MEMKWFELNILLLLNMVVIGCFTLFFRERYLRTLLRKKNITPNKEFFLTNTFIVNGIFLIEVSYYFSGLIWVHHEMSSLLGGISQPILYIYVISECSRSLFFIFILCFLLIRINRAIHSLKRGNEDGMV